MSNLEKDIATVAQRIADREDQRSKAALEGDSYKAVTLASAIANDTALWRSLIERRARERPVDSARPSGQVFFGSPF
jgi:hypothetical protein